MSDLSTPPLSLVPLGDEIAGAWRWPTPPFAGYADAPDWAGTPCEIEGLTSAAILATLIEFDPARATLRAKVQITGTTMDLRFEQFRRITLTTPVPAKAAAPDDQHAGLLGHQSVSEYRMRLAKGGGTLSGRSIGHVDAEYGVFLFPPQDGRGTVLRTFVPKSTFDQIEIGPRLGEVLVAQRSATAEQVEAAAAEQTLLRTRRLGELLLAEHIVDPAQLMAAIDQQAKMPVVRIGEALVALGLISDAQLKQALHKQKSDRTVPLGELLVRSGHVTRADLQLALARKMGYPVVDLTQFPVEADAVRAIPFAVSQRMQVLPLLQRAGQLIVAMADPSRRADVEELEFVSQLKIVPTMADGEALAAAITATYLRFGASPWGSEEKSANPDEPIEFSPADASKLLESLEQQHVQREAEEERQIEQSDNSLVRLVNTAIQEAHAQGVSDIHIETMPGREKVRIRFRKDGELRPYLELPHTYRSAIVARVKIMCDLDISERRKPQDGKINFARFSPQHRIELRVATIPTTNGLEDVVLRLLSSAKAIPMNQLGLTDDNYRRLRAAAERPYGMILCVGPTGSGKTTTLHSVLGHLNTPGRKIWTAEDPVEITQGGLRQVQVNPKIDWTFAKALRAFLRADPDVIMVGEIRDEETAQTAIEASLTGHLVLSTLHTNTAPDTVTRLLDMGMDPFNFGDSLLAVLAQRLVRRLCPHCRTSREATADEIDDLVHDWLHVYPAGKAPSEIDVRAQWIGQFGQGGRLLTYTAPGCDQCDRSGLAGRVALQELMCVSREVRRMIQTGARSEELQHQAMADGMRTLRQDGIEKVLAGMTSIAEVRATSNV